MFVRRVSVLLLLLACCLLGLLLLLPPPCHADTLQPSRTVPENADTIPARSMSWMPMVTDHRLPRPLTRGWFGDLWAWLTTPSEATTVTQEDGEEDVEVPSCACSCGQTSTRTRIVGGEETRVTQYPWMAMLTYKGRFYCGATLVTASHVLTAAHCVVDFPAEGISVRLLEHDVMAEDESAPLTRGLAKVTVHPRYDASSHDHDIALLQLQEPVDLGGDLQPACLPFQGERYTGAEGVVTGWGVTNEGGQPSSVLREVTVPVLPNSRCRSLYFLTGSQVTENMMCAGYIEGGKDSCQGDSGGPMHVKNGTAHQIVGVVSYGIGCARPGLPGVYSRVNRYLSWIVENTEGACFCTPA